VWLKKYAASYTDPQSSLMLTAHDQTDEASPKPDELRRLFRQSLDDGRTDHAVIWQSDSVTQRM